MDEDSIHHFESQNKDWAKHSYISVRCWSCLLGDGHYKGTDTTGKSDFALPQHKQFYQLSSLCCFSTLPHKFYPLVVVVVILFPTEYNNTIECAWLT